MKRWMWVLVLGTGWLGGCKPDAAVREGKAIGRGVKVEQGPPLHEVAASAVPVAEARTGGVSGTIRYPGKAPARLRIDMSMDPACGMSGGGQNMSEPMVVNGGKLANVYLYLKNAPAELSDYPDRHTMPVVLDQVGCRYTPHVVAVQRGATVEFHNSDVTMHNIHALPVVAGNEAFDVTQGPKGTPQTKRFAKAEVMLPIRCNNHPWMNAFVNVSETPFYAVSDAAGHFEIKGLPAGTYTLAAVHERLGEQVQTITVRAEEMAKADFTYAAR